MLQSIWRHSNFARNYFKSFFWLKIILNSGELGFLLESINQKIKYYIKCFHIFDVVFLNSPFIFLHSILREYLNHFLQNQRDQPFMIDSQKKIILLMKYGFLTLFFHFSLYNMNSLTAFLFTGYLCQSLIYYYNRCNEFYVLCVFYLIKFKIE